jgi:hypothetical protein
MKTRLASSRSWGDDLRNGCKSKVTLALVAALLAACASPPAVAPAPPLRQTLGQGWLDAKGQVKWPPHEGFTAEPIPMILPPGLLLDRFGGENGRFFSPTGASYEGRALPYDCRLQPYRTYRVKAPLLVWVGRAAPWFDQSGGATQFETDATAAQLVADATIEPVDTASGAPCPSH